MDIFNKKLKDKDSIINQLEFERGKYKEDLINY